MRLVFLLVLCLSSISCKREKISQEEMDLNKAYMFQAVSPDSSMVHFANHITEDADHSIINYIYYYNGAGVAVGDVNNDGLPDLYFVGNSVPNKLYLNKGDFQFEDVTDVANLGGKASWQTGATMVDINGDGWLDIYVSAVSGLLDFTGHNELYINNADGTFTETSGEYGLDIQSYATQAYFFDYDKDDDLDVYIVNHAIHTTYSYGAADSRNERQPLVGDMLLRNNNGKFEDVSEAANIYGGPNSYGLSASLADYNNDGWTDIYVCNDFHENDYYYINNGDGTFREKIDEAFSIISNFSMGSDAADINGDGLPDLITLDMLPEDERILKETEGDDAMYFIQQRLKKLGYKDQFARNMLQINNDNGKHFTEKALMDGVADSDWSWAALFADFNNDSHQDLFISNGILRRPNSLDFRKYVASAFKGRNQDEGLKWLYRSIDSMPGGKVANKIYEGNSETFSNKTGTWIPDEAGLSNGAVYADLDLDGNLDLIVNNLNAPASIYRNSNKGINDFVSFKLNYRAKNLHGIGTTVNLYANNKLQTRSLYNSRGFLSSVSGDLHFGLGETSAIDSVIVIWPNLKEQVLKDIAANQRHEIVYEESLPEYKFKTTPEIQPVFKKTETLQLTHQEDNYNDFLNEKLIPYKVSTLGPAVATGDVDGNGFEDIFIGGSSGNAGAFYLNTGEELVLTPVTAFEQDSMYEDNTAVFFDADGDGDPDLYVGSGISQNSSDFFMDRLYLYNNGVFELSENTIPDNKLITSVVKANDFDDDGDIDLFVGNLSEAGHFGSSVSSYILVNNGRGIFSKLENFSLESKVNDALWKDLNGDGRNDLVVATEWDAPKIFFNTGNGLESQEVPSNLNGLWQSVAVYDIDGDGDEDILLGNWGENSKFKPTPEAPLKMYYLDFDKNNKTETVMAYKKGDSYYPVHSKDELAGQLTVIKKRYVKHADYAMKTMEDIFTPYTLGQAQLNEVHLLSSGYLENNNGQFTRFVRFSYPLQLAPINTFSRINLNGSEGIMVAGNTYRSNNYQGSHSALKGYVINNNGSPIPVSDLGIASFKEEVRAIGQIELKDHKLLLIINNDAPAKLYRYEN
ncbi:VCBS repeat-containing protein [Salinimicrobium xinjiangense]|uniref:VCBS repeat-containing protein n=1 Tax=Salinimicrobium xinjiangense TaxID=438596 RepID=UPI0004918602|nr:VCBS repeat-containing protein [Salinimicrobium xinjiangense]